MLVAQQPAGRAAACAGRVLWRGSERGPAEARCAAFQCHVAVTVRLRVLWKIPGAMLDYLGWVHGFWYEK